MYTLLVGVKKVLKVKLFEYVIHFKWFESVEQLRTI